MQSMRDNSGASLLPKITFVEPDGSKRVVEARAGQSAMEAAVRAGVHGIIAECGGACSCATCHVYVDDAWFGRLAPKSVMEDEMLAFADEPRPNSRLSCQIRVSDGLDGLALSVPENQ